MLPEDLKANFYSVKNMITKEELWDLMDESWQTLLNKEFKNKYWDTIVKKLNSGPYFPPKNEIFAAINRTKHDRIKCVIVGQDPYFKIGEAHGFSFSVKKPFTEIPPSLKNIFNEIRESYNLSEFKPKTGDLSPWSDEGVMLLNSILTVSPGKPLSHENCGWKEFTNSLLSLVRIKNPNCVFAAFGRYAQESCKEASIFDIVEAGHPSPKNTFNPFRGSGVFLEINRSLIRKNIRPIRWKILIR